MAASPLCSARPVRSPHAAAALRNCAMAGIKLTTGETIGAWSLAQHDGKVEAFEGDEEPREVEVSIAGSSAAGLY